jgi:hypothetical protein
MVWSAVDAYTERLPKGMEAALQWAMPMRTHDATRGNMAIARAEQHKKLGMRKEHYIRLCALRAHPHAQLSRLCAIVADAHDGCLSLLHASVHTLVHHVGELEPTVADDSSSSPLRLSWQCDWTVVRECMRASLAMLVIELPSPKRVAEVPLVAEVLCSFLDTGEDSRDCAASLVVADALLPIRQKLAQAVRPTVTPLTDESCVLEDEQTAMQLVALCEQIMTACATELVQAATQWPYLLTHAIRRVLQRAPKGPEVGSAPPAICRPPLRASGRLLMRVMSCTRWTC